MAGTDHKKPSLTGGPAIVLVAPQLGENIGTAARAMLNCGLDDLRLVSPRDGWPSEKAVAAASGADSVLDKARLYPNLKAAVADLRHVYASTARDRYMVKRAVTPRLAAQEIRGFLALDETCGVSTEGAFTAYSRSVTDSTPIYGCSSPRRWHLAAPQSFSTRSGLTAASPEACRACSGTGESITRSGRVAFLGGRRRSRTITRSAIVCTSTST